MSGQWTVRDVDADVLDAVKLLKRVGAIRNVGKAKLVKEREYREWPDIDVLNKWEWKPEAKEYLQAYYDQLPLFPCDHPAHICNPREVDAYSCRHCIDEGEYPEYSRERLEEAGVV